MKKCISCMVAISASFLSIFTFGATVTPTAQALSLSSVGIPFPIRVDYGVDMDPAFLPNIVLTPSDVVTCDTGSWATVQSYLFTCELFSGARISETYISHRISGGQSVGGIVPDVSESTNTLYVDTIVPTLSGTILSTTGLAYTYQGGGIVYNFVSSEHVDITRLTLKIGDDFVLDTCSVTSYVSAEEGNWRGVLTCTVPVDAPTGGVSVVSEYADDAGNAGMSDMFPEITFWVREFEGGGAVVPVSGGGGNYIPTPSPSEDIKKTPVTPEIEAISTDTSIPTIVSAVPEVVTAVCRVVTTTCAPISPLALPQEFHDRAQCEKWVTSDRDAQNHRINILGIVEKIAEYSLIKTGIYPYTDVMPLYDRVLFTGIHHGIITTERDIFEPTKNVTRAEAYAMFLSMAELSFDDTVEPWTRAVYDVVHREGFTIRSWDEFEPNSIISAYELFVISARVDEYLQKNQICLGV